jgi:hypothetical protein
MEMGRSSASAQKLVRNEISVAKLPVGKLQQFAEKLSELSLRAKRSHLIQNKI